VEGGKTNFQYNNPGKGGMTYIKVVGVKGDGSTKFGIVSNMFYNLYYRTFDDGQGAGDWTTMGCTPGVNSGELALAWGPTSGNAVIDFMQVASGTRLGIEATFRYPVYGDQINFEVSDGGSKIVRFAFRDDAAMKKVMNVRYSAGPFYETIDDTGNWTASHTIRMIYQFNQTMAQYMYDGSDKGSFTIYGDTATGGGSLTGIRGIILWNNNMVAATIYFDSIKVWVE
jgi:hypothetical protein